MSQTMIDAMRSVGLCPAKSLDLADDGKLHRYRVDGDKAGSTNRSEERRVGKEC